MKHGLQEIDWSYVGAVLAREGDNVQAQFFKAFIKECQSWGTTYQVEYQLSGVNYLLTDKEREVIAMLGYKREGT